jgi:hypothetical protein
MVVCFITFGNELSENPYSSLIAKINDNHNVVPSVRIPLKLTSHSGGK